MEPQIKGRIIWKGDRQQKTSTAGNSYAMQEFLIEYQNGQYQYTAGFVAFNKTTGIVDRLLIGDIVTVTFRPTSATNNGKIFTTLTAWSIQPHWNELDTNPQPAPASDEPKF